MSVRAMAFVIPVLVAGATSPIGVDAQSIEERVGSADGEVGFHYKGREGLTGCGDGSISFGDHRWRHSGWNRARDCGPGPALVILDVRNGEVTDLTIRVGPSVHLDPDLDRDLGRVGATQAADYLLGLVRTARESVAEDAVFGAFVADSTTVWPELVEVARDRSRPEDVRSTALFWIGQDAAEAATEGLADVARDEREDRSVREAAVFALSQRPEREGVPILMEVATTAEDADTRKSAMFWLAQADDPAVLDFFEEILVGRR